MIAFVASLSLFLAVYLDEWILNVVMKFFKLWSRKTLHLASVAPTGMKGKDFSASTDFANVVLCNCSALDLIFIEQASCVTLDFWVPKESCLFVN